MERLAASAQRAQENLRGR